MIRIPETRTETTDPLLIPDIEVQARPTTKGTTTTARRHRVQASRRADLFSGTTAGHGLGGLFVTYLRLSKEKKAKKGEEHKPVVQYGLDAQDAACETFLRGIKPIAQYIEIETGKNNDRPELLKALDHCKRTGATLLIAKLDRLSRDAHFLLGLEKAGVDFICADMPDANKLTVGIMAVIAQHERETIARRTREGLEAAKRAGVKLGNPHGWNHKLPDAKRGHEAQTAAANEHAKRVGPIITDLREQGQTLQQIADTLTGRHIRTARGGAWTPTAVRNILVRLGSK